jgi:monofunctional biosynthetic peptidoglycan transglycosylase
VSAAGRSLARLLALVVLSAIGLQLFFLARVALMAAVDPQSTAFQRSELWRLVTMKSSWSWQQQWAPCDRISTPLKRAVIASEDAGFTEHSGVEWDAIEKAWERNQKAEADAARREHEAERRAPPSGAVRAPDPRPVRIVGGSTITQQLAKNLFLAGERHLARKAQEVVITAFLELLLGKERILEIYLNSVEWGEGVFGADAAARHYFHVGANALTAPQAARLAVMLPAPKRFEKRPASAYLNGRTATVLARMGAVELP